MVREGTVVTGGGNAILEIWFLKSKSSKHYHRMLSDPTFPNSFKNYHIYVFYFITLNQLKKVFETANYDWLKEMACLLNLMNEQLLRSRCSFAGLLFSFFWSVFFIWNISIIQFHISKLLSILYFNCSSIFCNCLFDQSLTFTKSSLSVLS